MKPASTPESLRRQTADVLGRQEPWPAVASPRPPRAGDLLMLSTQDEPPDFWLVVEQQPGPDAGLRLAPADVDPICGASDVALAATAAAGALTVRCAFAVWLPSAAVRPLARAGSLEQPSLTKVRERLDALDAGESAGTALDLDTEAELAYRDLLAELDAARDQLLAGARASEASDGATPHRPSAARPFTSPLAIAASLLLALAFGLITGWTWRGSRVPARPPQVASPEPLTNLPFEWLAPSQALRGRAPGEPSKILTVPPQAPYFALFLDVGVGSGETDFQLEIRDRDAGEVVWQGDARRTGTAEVFVLLPTAGLSPGDYAFTLESASDPDHPRLVYELRIAHGAAP